MEPSSTTGGNGPPSATATTVAPAFPSPLSGFPARPLGAGLLLAVIAVAALVMARRRRQAPRLVEIVETASLGPKRSLVVARMGEELLVLGSSEGGITLLSTRPAPPSTASARVPPERAVEAVGAPAEPARLRDLFARLKPVRPPAPRAFDELLAESDEDLDLRRKLAAGRSGSIQ